MASATAASIAASDRTPESAGASVAVFADGDAGAVHALEVEDATG